MSRACRLLPWLLLPVALGLLSVANADDVHCPPGIGSVSIDGNVLVVSGNCRLDGTTVKGNVKLYSGGALVATGTTIDGNIQADDADYVDVRDSAIDGDIQLDGLVGDSSRMVGNRVDGNIQLDDNRSALQVERNIVAGDIQAFGNRGSVTITDNRVDGNLQCKGNDPAPVGGGNMVSGNKEDQCANLRPAAGDGGSHGDSGGSTGSSSGSSGSSGGIIDGSDTGAGGGTGATGGSDNGTSSGFNASGGGGSIGPADVALLAILLLIAGIAWFGGRQSTSTVSRDRRSAAFFHDEDLPVKIRRVLLATIIFLTLLISAIAVAGNGIEGRTSSMGAEVRMFMVDRPDSCSPF